MAIRIDGAAEDGNGLVKLQVDETGAVSAPPSADPRAVAQAPERPITIRSRRDGADGEDGNHGARGTVVYPKGDGTFDMAGALAGVEVLGVLTEDIADGSTGRVAIAGLADVLWDLASEEPPAVDEMVWLSGANPGRVTNDSTGLTNPIAVGVIVDTSAYVDDQTVKVRLILGPRTAASAGGGAPSVLHFKATYTSGQTYLCDTPMPACKVPRARFRWDSVPGGAQIDVTVAQYNGSSFPQAFGSLTVGAAGVDVVVGTPDPITFAAGERLAVVIEEDASGSAGSGAKLDITVEIEAP